MNDNLKKLTGKNPQAFETVAFNTINMPDTALFAELVGQEDFLFDFVKRNVASRLEKACTKSNYRNLYEFLKFYSPSYENFIISAIIRFGGDESAERMLEIFKNGTPDEKTYCAKYFELTKNKLALDLLKKHAYDENPYLSANCAAALAVLGDEESFREALELLNSADEFTKLDAVKFLVSYGDKTAVPQIIRVMKTSSMADNMAGELLYLSDLFEIYKNNNRDGFFVLNSVISGLGDILGLSQVFDFKLYDFLSEVIKSPADSASASVLLAAQDKFAILTENDEYLYDETKDTKQEIYDIKKLLNNADNGELYVLSDGELTPDSPFVFTALEFTESEDAVRSLLTAQNPALVLKALETLKLLECLTQQDKETALNSVTDKNVRMVINAI